MRYSVRDFVSIISILVFFIMLTPLSSYAGINDDLINAAMNGNINKIKSLIEEGADVDAKNNDGWTALILAASNGQTEAIKVLIAKGADINAKDKNNGGTALLCAAANGQTEAAKLLIEKGADVDAKDNEGRTALLVAASKGQTEAIKLLIEKGADVYAKSYTGGTALLWAAANGQTEAAKVLIDKGTDINAKDKNGRTALLLAAWNGHTEAIKLLIEKGADINAKDKNTGGTALLWAASKGQTEAIKLLIEKGADVNAKNNDGRTALMVAEKEGKTETVEILRQAMGKGTTSPEIAKDTTSPVVAIIEPSLSRGVLVIEKTSKKAIIGEARDASGISYIKVNGKDVPLEQISGGVRFIADVMLSLGDNSIKVEAMDTKDNKTVKTFVIKREEEKIAYQTVPQKQPITKPSLYILSIGVSEYKNPSLNLRYADHDAQKLSSYFGSQKGKLFKEVYTKTLLNGEATRDNVLGAMSSFLGQASFDDVVIIFVAGHGIKHKQSGSYYFLTHDAEPSNLMSRGLKWSDFEESMKIIKDNVSKVILLVDTCHAGAMQVAMRGAEAGEDLAMVLREAEGTYILSSSKGGEESEEGEQFKFQGEQKGHGAFTYALLEGLKGSADLDSDGHITIFELNAYVGKAVPKLTKGRQHPYPKVSGTDMPIYQK